MKVYTKKGDNGHTTLVDGTSIEKSNLRLDCYGTVDELNSHLGLLTSMLHPLSRFEKDINFLQDQQNKLFNLGSQLACESEDILKKLPTITEVDVKKLESEIDQLTESLPQLRNFILPGGSPASAQAHICRTLCRKCERLCVELHQQSPLSYPAISYLNRLSDYLFTLARFINHELEITTLEWQPE